MAAITHRHVQEAFIERAAARIATQVDFRLSLQRAVQQSGVPNVPARNGYYDDDGKFHLYLRLDMDDFDSGRGLAP